VEFVTAQSVSCRKCPHPLSQSKLQLGQTLKLTVAPKWIPALKGVEAKLEAGAKVAAFDKSNDWPIL
jgi:hypothetical protein